MSRPGKIRLIGANPFLLLYSGEAAVAFASVWQVDWSERGSGAAIVMWLGGETRVLGPDPALGTWLASDFTRHFPEAKSLPWPGPVVTTAPIEIDLDPERGLRATSADVAIEINGPPLDRRLYRNDAFELAGERHILSTVVMPCPSGRLLVHGVAVDAAPHVSVEGAVPSSTAVIAVAEVWCHPRMR